MGRLVHFETHVYDMERAKKFDGEVYGWSFQDGSAVQVIYFPRESCSCKEKFQPTAAATEAPLPTSMRNWNESTFARREESTNTAAPEKKPKYESFLQPGPQ